jgi:hypothetical protein
MNPSIENSFCLVTSLFNVKRENMEGNDGRSWDDYLKWFKKTLEIKCPMTIFVEEDLVKFVEESRTYPTKIITHSVSEIPYYFLKDRIQNILDTEEYKVKIDCPERIECQHSMYTVVQYSKFKWLERAIEENFLNSKYFFWIDAGASRHFDGFDINNVFPSQVALKSLNGMGEKFLMQLNMDIDFCMDLALAETLTENYLWDARAITCGSFFGGEVSAAKRVCKEVDDVWINKMINKNLVNNEQIVLAYLLKTKPEMFAEYKRYNGKHMDIFKELT